MNDLYTWIKTKNGFIITALGLVSLVHFIFLKRFDVSNSVAIFDSLVSNLALLLLAFVLQNIQNFYHAKHPINIVNIGVIKVFSMILVAFMAWVGNYFFAEEHLYRHFWDKQYIVRGLFAFLVLFVILYQFWLNKNEALNRENTEKLIEIERQLKQAELTNIHQQLKPHFLFNSLNSISALTMIEPLEAQRMVHLLSDFLRGTLEQETERFALFSAEIKQVERYLEIEKIRFGNRLSIRYEIDAESMECKIPKLIIQPLIENAIKHGLYGQTEALEIVIQTKMEGSFLYLSIENPYDSNFVKNKKGAGFGISSIKRKLEIHYKQANLVSIQQEANQFKVILKIPTNA